MRNLNVANFALRKICDDGININPTPGEWAQSFGIESTYAKYDAVKNKYKFIVTSGGCKFELTRSHRCNKYKDAVTFVRYTDSKGKSHRLKEVHSYYEDMDLIDTFIKEANGYNDKINWKIGIEDLIIKILLRYFSDIKKMKQSYIIAYMIAICYGYDAFNREYDMPVNMLADVRTNNTCISLVGDKYESAVYQAHMPSSYGKDPCVILDTAHNIIYYPISRCLTIDAHFNPDGSLQDLVRSVPFVLGYSILAVMIDISNDKKFIHPSQIILDTNENQEEIQFSIVPKEEIKNVE